MPKHRMLLSKLNFPQREILVGESILAESTCWVTFDPGKGPPVPPGCGIYLEHTWEYHHNFSNVCLRKVAGFELSLVNHHPFQPLSSFLPSHPSSPPFKQKPSRKPCWINTNALDLLNGISGEGSLKPHEAIHFPVMILSGPQECNFSSFGRTWGVFFLPAEIKTRQSALTQDTLLR